jgi:ribosomal protein S18 acetylase RimI-like enzyme
MILPVMETVIRRYNHQDKFECITAFKSNFPEFFTETEMKDFEYFLDNLENPAPSDVTTGGLNYYCVVHNGVIAGCGGFAYDQSANVVTLTWGMVHRDFQRKGLGGKLLMHRLAEIKSLFPDAKVSLDTTQHSCSFFQKYGFVTEKITPDFYDSGLHRYDMVLDYK